MRLQAWSLAYNVYKNLFFKQSKGKSNSSFWWLSALDGVVVILSPIDLHVTLPSCCSLTPLFNFLNILEENRGERGE